MVTARKRGQAAFLRNWAELRRKAACPLFCAVLAGCGEAWQPESIIEDLRVLGVRAEPAELKPGESASLSALILDPNHPGQPITTLWIGCDPDPFAKGRSACSDAAALNEPSRLVSGTELPPGVRFIGLNDNASYGTDPTLFDVLAADDERRQTGTVGQILAISIAGKTSPIPTMQELAALFARVQAKEIKSVITLFRVKVSESTVRNTNPSITAFTVAGEPHPVGAHVQVYPAQELELGVVAPEAAFEPYVEVTPTTREEKRERITSAWYSTAGRFKDMRVALKSEVKPRFTGPGHPDTRLDVIPPRRVGTFWVVLRDSRGGQAWTQKPFYVCDITVRDPIVTAVRAPATRADLLVVEGRDLEGILDVVVGGHALVKGTVNAVTGNYEALIPNGLAPGEYPVALTRKSCRPARPSFTVVVP